jgi:hypothetical protein
MLMGASCQQGRVLMAVLLTAACCHGKLVGAGRQLRAEGCCSDVYRALHVYFLVA